MTEPIKLPPLPKPVAAMWWDEKCKYVTPFLSFCSWPPFEPLANFETLITTEQAKVYARAAVKAFKAVEADRQARGEPVELKAVPETIAEGGGFWRSCTGCHETNEGYATGPYSKTLKCHLGVGCRECGGIGAIWDTTDYDVMADYMAQSMGATQPAEPTFDFAAHLKRQREWSERTFGPGSRAAGIVDHIRKELREIEADPGDLKEWVDVIILALDGAWRSGATPHDILDAIVAKQTKNEGRAWPDWRAADPNKAIEHDRSQDAPQPQQIPEGYKLVPVEPTLEMIVEAALAAKQYMDECGGNSPTVIYKAMLKAAPEPKEQP